MYINVLNTAIILTSKIIVFRFSGVCKLNRIDNDATTISIPITSNFLGVLLNRKNAKTIDTGIVTLLKIPASVPEIYLIKKISAT